MLLYALAQIDEQRQAASREAKARMKALGILDGMGPAATAAFLQRILELTPAPG